MKRTIISMLMILGLIMFVGVAYSLPDEIVFCVSQKDQEAILMDAKGLCNEGQSEYVISGSGLERSEDLAPLAVFSDNGDCGEGSTGTTTRVGFDKNGDSKLGDDEVMVASGTCVAFVQDEDE